VAFITKQGQVAGLAQWPQGVSLPGGRVLSQFPTTSFERFLLVTLIIILPLEEHIPAVAGLSSLFILFGVLGGYVLVNRATIFNKVLIHRVFLASYAFIGVSALLESLSPFTLYRDIFRFGQMIAGAILVASLCRDRLALRACLYGYIGLALWLSVVLFLTSYGTLSGMTAGNFDEASVIRHEVMQDSPVTGNFNGFAFMSVQGGIVALVFALAGGSPLRCRLFSVIAVFCLVASFLAMSRSAVAIGIVSCAAVLYAHGIRHGKALILVGLLGLIIYIVVPDTVWSRMTFSTEVREGKMEARADLYWKALQHLDDYMIIGVGAGNFWNKWGFDHGFASGSAFSIDVSGLHNTFLQVTINWGLPGLLALTVVIWQAYRCLPKRSGSDPLALGVLGIAVSLVLFLNFTHNYEDKLLSLGLGMLVASRYWIWPSGLVLPVKKHRSQGLHFRKDLHHPSGSSAL